MLDPWSALASAAAIAQFAQMVYQLIKGAYDISRSSTGSTAENEQLGFVMQKLAELSDKLVSKKPEYDLNDADKALDSVARKCKQLSTQLLDLLNRISSKDPHSLRQNAIAVLKDSWNKSEKEELMKQIEDCRRLMDTQLTFVMNSETVRLLRQLIKSGKSDAADLASLHRNVHLLQSGVDLKSISPEAGKHLRTLLDLSESALQAVTQHRFLDSLRFENMHKRFNTVDTAAAKTFEWILRNESEIEEQDDTKIEDSDDSEAEVSDDSETDVQGDSETDVQGDSETDVQGDSEAETEQIDNSQTKEQDDSKTERQDNSKTEEQDNPDPEEQNDSKMEERYHVQRSVLFKDWLVSGDGIFHIAGKPGSGKSTLMKFLYNSDRTIELLRKWAAGRKLVFAKFFFWKTGTEMENSLQGLYCSLLHDCLEQCPELTPQVFPNQWAKVESLPWQAPIELQLSGDEIRKAFQLLMECFDLHKNRCFCFFIDGLDEYHETALEDFGDVAQIFCDWTKKPPGDIKLCVSSRELTVFNDYFDGAKKIRLQDLTREDMTKVVQERLESHKMYSALECTESQREDFIGEIVEKSEGVFLWITLVVKTLRDALTHDGTFPQLKLILTGAPKDLKELYPHLLESIPEPDYKQSAQTFKLFCTLWKHCKIDRMSLFAYSYLDEFGNDPEFAYKLSTAGPGLSKKELGDRLERAKRRLYGRSRGLLEIRKTDSTSRKIVPQDDVTVVHRSIHEFFETAAFQDWMRPHLGDFLPVRAICQFTIATIKLLSPRRVKPQQGSTEDLEDTLVLSFEREIAQALWCIREDVSDIESHLDVLERLDILLQEVQHPERQRRDAVSRRLLPLFYWDIPREAYRLSIPHAVAQAGIHQYFTKKFDRHNNAVSSVFKINWLCELAIESGANGPLILESIFHHGISPNQSVNLVYGGVELSNWEWFLFDWLDAGSNSLMEWEKSAEVYLKFGARSDGLFSLGYQGVVIISYPDDDPGKSRREWHVLYDNSRFWPLLRSRGNKASFREALEFLQPANLKTLLRLMDQNIEGFEKSSATLVESVLDKDDESTEDQSSELRSDSKMVSTVQQQKKRGSLQAKSWIDGISWILFIFLILGTMLTSICIAFIFR